MKIRVTLCGTIRSLVPACDDAGGLALEVPDHLTLEELIAQLGIPQTKVGPVAVNDKIVKRDAVIPDKARVKIFQPVFGG